MAYSNNDDPIPDTNDLWSQYKVPIIIACAIAGCAISTLVIGCITACIGSCRRPQRQEALRVDNGLTDEELAFALRVTERSNLTPLLGTRGRAPGSANPSYDSTGTRTL